MNQFGLLEQVKMPPSQANDVHGYIRSLFYQLKDLKNYLWRISKTKFSML